MVHFALVLALLPSLVAGQETVAASVSHSSRFAPRMRVSIAPFEGVIPATMANGRPVYRFTVFVLDPETKHVASSDTVLQAGMERKLKGRESPNGWVRGTVRISRIGAASYQVEYLRDGQVVLDSSTVVHVRGE